MTQPQRRLALATGATVLALTALLLPTAWYDAMPHPLAKSPVPISGVSLFRMLLFVEAIALGAAAWLKWEFVRLAPSSRVSGLERRHDDGDLPSRQAAWWLMGVTLLALALRLYGANSDLWLDEIWPILDYGNMPLLQIVGSYVQSNNHLLNTLLVKVTVAMFGEHEWSVRLPAILFGVAAVPVLYACARFALTRRGALGAAALLAVSYHHIFFSQNSRGYSGYLCFALLSSLALLNGLRDDRRRWWVLFIVATFLGCAAFLNTLFVVSAQAIIALVAVWQVRRRGGATTPLIRRLFVVFGVAALLSVQIYITVLPDVYAVITAGLSQQSAGFSVGSLEFVREMLRGIVAGFGTGARIAAGPFLLLAAAGSIALFRRSWALTLALALPGVLTAILLFTRGLAFTPRYFLLWLPLAVITAVVALDAGARLLWRGRGSARQRLVTAVVCILVLISGAALRRYYATPKQPYRAALAYTEQRRAPDDIVVAVHNATMGVRYYGARMHLPVESRYRFVGSVRQLDSVLATPGRGRAWLLVTLERTLQMTRSELVLRIQKDWVRDRTFAGTIGNGDITVWRERESASPARLDVRE